MKTDDQSELTTKERILYESMKLFAISGFEAVSIRTIADEVGVTNSALYKHYKNKQAIFDAIVDLCKDRYLKQCKDAVKMDVRTIEQLKEVCLGMFYYQIHDEWIVMFRQMLLIEKFRNPQMATIYKEFFVDIPVKIQQDIFVDLMERGIMKKKNPEVLSMELYAPFFLYHIVERDEAELQKLYELHAEYFFENYVLE